ncbi:DALR anticodon-binding domain-containing protein, partial [Bartonella grahamii]
SFLAAVKRTVNILENAFQKSTIIANEITPELFIEKEEKQLYQEIIEVEKKVHNHISAINLSGALNTLAQLGKFIDIFFEKVLVNDKNPDIRANRLALLKRIHTITEAVADFSKLVV